MASEPYSLAKKAFVQALGLVLDSPVCGILVLTD